LSSSGTCHTYAPNTNFCKFKEKLSRSTLKEYGDLVRLIERMEYWEPEEVDAEQYDLEDDPPWDELLRNAEELHHQTVRPAAGHLLG
jgi:hypothetical protein